MALALDAASTASTTNASSLTWSHNNVAGNVLFATLGNADGAANSQLTSSATYNAVAMTEVWDVSTGLGGAASSGHILINPATGANNIVITIAGSVFALGGGAQSYTGCDTAAPNGTGVSNSGTGTTSTATVTSAAGEIVVDGSFVNTSGAITVGAGQTSRGEVDGIGFGFNAFGHSSEPGAASVDMTWTFSSNAWACGAVSLKPLAATRGEGFFIITS